MDKSRIKISAGKYKGKYIDAPKEEVHITKGDERKVHGILKDMHIYQWFNTVTVYMATRYKALLGKLFLYWGI